MRRFRAVLVGCVIGLAVPASASAVTLNVQAGAADDAGSASGCTAGSSAGTYNCTTLRDAVAFANTSPDAGTDPTIKLSAGEFDLTNGALKPTVSLSITGVGDQGSSVTTIKQTGTLESAVDAYLPLTLNDLVITGVPLSGAGRSGGIDADGLGIPLTLNGVTVTGSTNHAADGDAATGSNPGETPDSAYGAAITVIGTLTLTDSVVSGNEDIGGDGGAASATEVPGTGGEAGAVIQSGALVMSGSIVMDNHSTAGNGGAAAASGQTGGSGGAVTGAGISAGPITITSSVISGNQALVVRQRFSW